VKAAHPHPGAAAAAAGAAAARTATDAVVRGRRAAAAAAAGQGTSPSPGRCGPQSALPAGGRGRRRGCKRRRQQQRPAAQPVARRPPSPLGVEGGGGADLSNIIPLSSMCSATAGPGSVQEQQAGGRKGRRGPAVPAEQLVDTRRWTLSDGATAAKRPVVGTGRGRRVTSRSGAHSADGEDRPRGGLGTVVTPAQQEGLLPPPAVQAAVGLRNIVGACLA